MYLHHWQVIYTDLAIVAINTKLEQIVMLSSHLLPDYLVPLLADDATINRVAISTARSRLSRASISASSSGRES
jgi:hypothetical protein